MQPLVINAACSGSLGWLSVKQPKQLMATMKSCIDCIPTHAKAKPSPEYPVHTAPSHQPGLWCRLSSGYSPDIIPGQGVAQVRCSSTTGSLAPCPTHLPTTTQGRIQRILPPWCSGLAFHHAAGFWWSSGHGRRLPVVWVRAGFPASRPPLLLPVQPG